MCCKPITREPSRPLTLVNKATTFFCTFVVCLASPLILANQVNTDVKKFVCGDNEAAMFEGWSQAAGYPNFLRLEGLKNLKSVSVKAKDGNILRGYKLTDSRLEKTNTARGYLLVVQGNAMLADQILRSFVSFANRGYDIYIFDYRGYGRSGGNPLFNSILNDYLDIIDYLDSLNYAKKAYYGLSFGGVVLLNALKKPDNSRVVIDSTRSHFSEYGCPKVNDPIYKLPTNCSNFLIITGLKDQVVTPLASAKLLSKAKKCGASILKNAEFKHPFMDDNILIHNQRMNAVESFLFED